MATAQQEFSILRHRQQLLAVLIFSLMAIVVWVGVGLITSQESSSISPQLQQAATPLNPSINVEVLSTIEQQTAYDPSQLTSFPIYTLLSDDEVEIQRQSVAATNATGSSALTESLNALPIPSPSPVASESATPAASESATTTPSPTPAGV